MTANDDAGTPRYQARADKWSETLKSRGRGEADAEANIWGFARQLERELQAANERIARLEKDAARYHYMRSNAAFQDRNGPGLYWYLPRWNHDLPIGERLDAAIDSELSARRARAQQEADGQITST